MGTLESLDFGRLPGFERSAAWLSSAKPLYSESADKCQLAVELVVVGLPNE